MRTAERAVEALGDGLAIERDHRADERVRADPAAALFGELDRATQVAAITIGADWHLTGSGYAATSSQPRLCSGSIYAAPHRPPESRYTLISGPGRRYWLG